MKRAWVRRAVAAALLVCAWPAQAADSREEVQGALSKPVVRGGIVYKTYCSICHGQIGDGAARAAKLYGAATLSIQPGTREFFTKIVHFGGASVGKSPFMPPWSQELSKEQIDDVVEYLLVLSDGAMRGQVVFKTHCILCHGVSGAGDGRAARLMQPPPANLTRSDKNDQYKEMIITLGGEAMGRSPRMPVWGQELTAQEIKDVVTFLRTLLVVAPPGS